MSETTVCEYHRCNSPAPSRSGRRIALRIQKFRDIPKLFSRIGVHVARDFLIAEPHGVFAKDPPVATIFDNDLSARVPQPNEGTSRLHTQPPVLPCAHAAQEGAQPAGHNASLLVRPND